MVDLASTMYDDIENSRIGGKTVVLPASKDELPNCIVITNVPDEVFNNIEQRANFSRLFTEVEENVHFDFLKSFKFVSLHSTTRRVRLIFSSPENATTAKLIVQHLSFNGQQLKAFFAHRVILSNSSPHLEPPPLEKQFLISPPCSPPVGWEQTIEMAPVVCSFDLMARLAAFAVDDQYEVHTGDDSMPRIIVSPCETPLETPSSIEMPRTPRPQMDD
ncbi:rcan-1 [Pristionchus pacificus]|uniref:Rcn-1 n=1 Tax=Pristionchus pacificus TaxID=54126 RepID=A0A2A6B479_PRIPA|nr:rcan-1 [Pristionchus pacificus]|eukprot:PDM60686.1 rcn-1 [Pristionchus pacificus]